MNVYPETVSDGFGIRFAVYFSGCSHRCPGCHNPQSWNPHSGRILDGAFAGEIIARIRGNPLLDGVTFSGGDPMFNPGEFLAFLSRLKREAGLGVWCYTGYVYEDLLRDPLRCECLKHIDVLVDGPFVEALADPRLYFRGSSNQRIIELKNGRMERVLEPEREGWGA